MPGRRAAAAGSNARPSKPLKRSRSSAQPCELDSESLAVRQLHGGALAPALRLTSPTLLRDMLAPVTLAEFAQSIRARRALAVQASAPLRVSGLLAEHLELGDVPSLIDQSSSPEGVSVWLKPQRVAEEVPSIKVASPGDAAAMYSRGDSVYMRAPEELCSEFPRVLCEQLGTGVHFPDTHGEVEVFASHPGAWTRPHYDFQENFTLQLLGRKTWRVHAGRTQWPLRGITPHFANTPASVREQQAVVARMAGGPDAELAPPPESSELWREVTLCPGDFLYHPPGLWHSVLTVGDAPSLSINVSLVAPSFADVASWAVRQYLSQFQLARAPVPAAAPFAQYRALLDEHNISLGPFALQCLFAPSGPTEEEGFELTDRFLRNPLAICAFVKEEEAEEQEGAFALRVLVNVGQDQFEPLSATDLQLPLPLLGLVHKVQQSTGHILGAKLQAWAKPANWQECTAALVNAGLLVRQDQRHEAL